MKTVYIILFVATAHVATGLKCYKCDSAATPECGDPFTKVDAITEETCDEAIKSCIVTKTITLRADTARQGTTAIVRGCAAADSKEEDTPNKKVLLCAEDLCNGSNVAKPINKAALLLPFIISLATRNHYALVN